MEKINIAEILKDCPKGMELDCTMYDKVTLTSVDDRENIDFPIRVDREDGAFITLTKYGQYTDADFAKCVIFPKGKTTWEGFQRPFKDGDIVVAEDAKLFQMFILKEVKCHKNDGYNGDCYLGWDFAYNESFHEGIWEFDRLATEEEKQKLFDAIKANGYKWNPETKTLEKLPKFKVGDWVEFKYYERKPAKVIRIENNVYYLSSGDTLMFQDEHAWDLTTNKFDINTLVPFESKVLVRDVDHNEWEGAIFGRYDGKKFFTIGGLDCGCCIPYEGNEHLLGTTNDCDDYYKNWE